MKVSPESFTKGKATDIEVSWESVPNAGSYSVAFSGKTYLVEDGLLSYTIPGKTTSMLDAGSYTVKVYANPGKNDIYNTESVAGTGAFAVLPKGGGGEDEFIVASVEEFKTALEAGSAAGSVVTLLSDVDLTGKTWTPENKDAAYPMQWFPGANVGNYYLDGAMLPGTHNYTDMSLFDASYFRLKNITVGYTLPKKLRRLALLSVLSAKVADGEIIVVDSLNFEEPKTKEMVKVLGNLKAAKKALIVTAEKNDNLVKSAANIPGVATSMVGQMNVYEILNHTSLILTKDAVAKIEEVYA